MLLRPDAPIGERSIMVRIEGSGKTLWLAPDTPQWAEILTALRCHFKDSEFLPPTNRGGGVSAASDRKDG